MKKNCKAKVFCRLSVMRGALCGLLLLSLTGLRTTECEKNFFKA